MPLVLFSHPFASYCQKVLVALYENETPFTYRKLDRNDPAAFAELEQMWPLKRFPLLVDNGKPIIESSIIIEHLDRQYPGPVRLIPQDGAAALEVRFLDRFFDNYVHTPMQRIVADALRADGEHDPRGVADARIALEGTYSWLEQRLTNSTWAAGAGFSMADCAAAPALFYADWVHPIGAGFPNIRNYRQRLNARPSFARAIEEGRPYRALFPLGAPDRD
jgi:glutathione S-transferase